MSGGVGGVRRGNSRRPYPDNLHYALAVVMRATLQALSSDAVRSKRGPRITLRFKGP